MVAEFNMSEQNNYDESEEDFSSMILSTTVDDRPVKIIIQYEDPSDALVVLANLGEDESLIAMAKSLETAYREKQIHDTIGEFNDGGISFEDIFGRKSGG